ncbi:MAG: hypothetical protein ACYCZZ_01725 [Minisyncoccota bacterium]
MSVAKQVVLASIAVFLFVGAFGVAETAMTMGSDGHMAGCPLMGIPALCHMSPLEHASALQNMFAAIPFAGVLLFLVSLLLTLVGIPLFRSTWQIVRAFFWPIHAPPLRTSTYISQHSLQDAFSNGILHSKAY